MAASDLTFIVQHALLSMRRVECALLKLAHITHTHTGLALLIAAIASPTSNTRSAPIVAHYMKLFAARLTGD